MLTQYSEQYPRAGDVAVLCEGDLIGYEASTLRRWADAIVGTSPLVDVWPCGTASGMLGLSDAVGRSRPIVAIEDRDYREPQEAADDCSRVKADRRSRGVRVADWRCWSLNEIENYFLDAAILTEVMSEGFACSAADVEQALSEVIPSLAVCESVQYALYQVRRRWEASDTAHHLPDNVSCRPTWDATSCELQHPSLDAVRNQLCSNMRRWQERFGPRDQQQTDSVVSSCLDVFDARSAEWSRVDAGSAVWRRDWSGKEILKHLRLVLSARHAWWEPDARQRIRVQWTDMNRGERAGKDREIESALRPLMVRAFLGRLESGPEDAVRREWTEIESVLRNAGATAP